MIHFANAVCWTLLLATVANAQNASLKIRFAIDGPAPRPEQINAARAFPRLAVPLFNERLLVDQQSKGIQNVIVYVYTGRRGTKLPPVPNKGTERVLTMTNGRFDPRVVIAQVGDTLKVVDSGPAQHSAIIHFFRNQPQALTPKPNQPARIPLPVPEPGPIPIECNIHPWMRSYIVVLDHPYVAVSDATGNVTIQGLPENQTVHFQVWHEASIGVIKQVMIKDTIVDWPRGRFEVDLVAGVNDLGDVLIPASTLVHR